MALVVNLKMLIYLDSSATPTFAPRSQEDTMSIIRLIHIKIDPSETETAERIWKTECATLMISQKLHLREVPGGPRKKLQCSSSAADGSAPWPCFIPRNAFPRI
jgi:hypothetical protein